jgi:hypothetical protein
MYSAAKLQITNSAALYIFVRRTSPLSHLSHLAEGITPQPL